MNERDIQAVIKDHERRIKVLEGNRNKKEVSLDGQEETDIVLGMVNKIRDCPETNKIQAGILSKKNRDLKVLLCFYIARKYFNNPWITSGVVESVTKGLSIGIDIRNIPYTLKRIEKYLEQGTVRKRGLPTPYKLNSRGLQFFDEVLSRVE